MSDPQYPELVFPAPDRGLQVGAPALYWRGEKLDFPLLDEVQVTAGPRSLTVAVVRIPVTVRVEEQAGE